jgi:hypothetical protein
MNPTTVALLQTFVAMSVFYVWVVRYQAVLDDFEAFGIPAWLRDLVGGAKLTAAFLLLGIGPIEGLEVYGAGTIAFFMVAALGMHLNIKNPLVKMLPSIGLGFGAVVVLVYYLG